MTVEERFIQLIDRYKYNQHVICEDSVTGLRYTKVVNLPEYFAEQPAQCAYFEFRYKFVDECRGKL